MYFHFLSFSVDWLKNAILLNQANTICNFTFCFTWSCGWITPDVEFENSKFIGLERFGKKLLIASIAWADVDILSFLIC